MRQSLWLKFFLVIFKTKFYSISLWKNAFICKFIICKNSSLRLSCIWAPLSYATFTNALPHIYSIDTNVENTSHRTTELTTQATQSELNGVIDSSLPSYEINSIIFNAELGLVYGFMRNNLSFTIYDMKSGKFSTLRCSDLNYNTSVSFGSSDYYDEEFNDATNRLFIHEGNYWQ